MRKIVLALMLSTLAACQTVNPPPGLNARQVAVLQQNGFVQNGDAWELGMPDRLLFPTDESRLAADQSARLARLATALSEVGIRGATIEGHTDSTGAATYNRTLSQRRAEVVEQALAGGGMQAEAIRATGVGEADPIESNATAQGRQQNRRVVIVITAADAF